MPSNFDNVKNSGRSCIGCGKDVSQVNLKRIRSYGMALACRACILKHIACANVSPITGQACNHRPHIGVICQHCGCPEYIHGLQGEADRQLAACVGMLRRSKVCESYGAKLGKCGRLIFANGSGELSRLCDKCEREWMQQNIEQDREMAAELEAEKMTH